MSKWYGNVMNRIAENCKNPEPVVGMGATELMWSDRHPYEVIEVKDERHITVRELNAVMKEGHDIYDADYDYFTNEQGRIKRLFKKPNGRWVERIGRNGEGSKFALGFAEKYYDPSF